MNYQISGIQRLGISGGRNTGRQRERERETFSGNANPPTPPFVHLPPTHKSALGPKEEEVMKTNICFHHGGPLQRPENAGKKRNLHFPAVQDINGCARRGNGYRTVFGTPFL